MDAWFLLCLWKKTLIIAKMMLIWLVAGSPLVLFWELGRTKASAEAGTCHSAVEHIVSLSVNGQKCYNNVIDFIEGTFLSFAEWTA